MGQGDFRPGDAGMGGDMLLLVLSIPSVVLLLAGVLFLSALVEQRFLSPRAVVLSTVRARRSTPEYTEAMVAKQFEEMLRRAK
ncbi:MAG: hypothetical protein QOK43_996 [Acidimicrobiaceae bacterium]|nr:hypothetical protein [Acidimicrobiaceae bacterium]